MNDLNIGYVFQNKELLKTALTHSTYAADHKYSEDNQRLEFLGDSVLGFLTAHTLYLQYPGKDEGYLTRLRASYICEASLARAAQALELGGAMRFSKSENVDKLLRPSVLADAFEALLAAIYLDGGLEPAREFVENKLLSMPREAAAEDYKTLLQEKVQAMGKTAPTYTLLSQSGPEHELVFECACLIDGEETGRGQGRSKKTAEQAAAKAALEMAPKRRSEEAHETPIL